MHLWRNMQNVRKNIEKNTLDSLISRCKDMFLYYDRISTRLETTKTYPIQKECLSKIYSLFSVFHFIISFSSLQYVNFFQRK